MIRGILLLALAVLLAGCSRESPATSASPPPAGAKAEAKPPAEAVFDRSALEQARLEVVDVVRQSIPVTVHSSGRLTTNEVTTWRVGAITDGRLISVDAKVGDKVVKGQLLAKMYSHDIHEARAEYSRALAESVKARAQADFAQRQRDRAHRLLEMKAASLEQVEHAETELKTALSAVAAAEIEVARTKHHLTDYLEIPLEAPRGSPAESKGQKDEDLIPVHATAAGVVLSRLVTPGAVVAANSDLFIISDLSTLWAIAAVQEEHLPKLRAGMPARIEVQAYPDRRFHGRVLKIDEKLDAETRTVSVRIDVPNPGELLKPEMYATIELDAGASAEALFVPQVAVQDLGGKPTVFVEQGPGRFAPRTITAGRPLGGLIEVTSGLSGGERVVARGAFIVKSQLLRASMSEE
jgi:cobalt-zinc-cadmium efflux system membrane fusion protein